MPAIYGRHRADLNLPAQPAAAARVAAGHPAEYDTARGVMSDVTTRFGTFEVDLDTGELSRQGRSVRLQQQPFLVLRLLLRSAGSLVTREELKRHLWADGTAVEFDQSLNRIVAKLRQALGDPAANPRFIETLPKRGYRFIAPVNRIAPADDAWQVLLAAAMLVWANSPPRVEEDSAS